MGCGSHGEGDTRELQGGGMLGQVVSPPEFMSTQNLCRRPYLEARTLRV